MGLQTGRSYTVTTQSGAQSVRTYLGRNEKGQSLFGGVDSTGRRFVNRLSGSDMFVISIQPVRA